MGLRCSCGVRSNPTAASPSITLDFEDGGLRDGPITLTVDVCADSLELSTLSITFVDASCMLPNRSFSFTSTSITNVRCSDFNGACEVRIQGMGLVTGELTPRPFLVLLINRQLPLSDSLQVLIINGFLTNITNADLTPDLTFFGCPSTP